MAATGETLIHTQNNEKRTRPHRITFSQLNDLYVESKPCQLYVESTGHLGGFGVKVFNSTAAKSAELGDDALFTAYAFIC